MSEYPLTEKSNNGGARQYIYGPTGLIACVDSGATYYMFKDHLGSTRAVMNGANGTGVEYYSYDAWGKVIGAQVSPDVRYKYTGQEYDGQTGIYNYRARAYDQSLGRFYATDPAGQSFSPYGYARNNPMSYIDPTGTVDLYWESEQKRMEQVWEIQRAEEMRNHFAPGGFGPPTSYAEHYAIWANSRGYSVGESDWLANGAGSSNWSRSHTVVTPRSGHFVTRYSSVESGEVYRYNSKGELVVTGHVETETSSYEMWVEDETPSSLEGWVKGVGAVIVGIETQNGVLELAEDVGKATEKFIEGSKTVGRVFGIVQFGAAIEEFATDRSVANGAKMVVTGGMLLVKNPYVLLGTTILDITGVSGEIYKRIDSNVNSKYWRDYFGVGR